MKERILKNLNMMSLAFCVIFALAFVFLYVFLMFCFMHGVVVRSCLSREDILYMSIIVLVIHACVLLPGLWLGGMIPKTIRINEESLLVKGMLGAYTFNPSSAKVLWQMDYGNVWAVAYFSRWRIIFINSSSFPSLKRYLFR